MAKKPARTEASAQDEAKRIHAEAENHERAKIVAIQQNPAFKRLAAASKIFADSQSRLFETLAPYRKELDRLLKLHKGDRTPEIERLIGLIEDKTPGKAAPLNELQRLELDQKVWWFRTGKNNPEIQRKIDALRDTKPKNAHQPELWISASDAAERSGLSTSTLLKRANRDNWTKHKSGRETNYQYTDLENAYPARNFRKATERNPASRSAP